MQIELTGGNVAGRVVRVGSTVRKPAGPSTDAVDALNWPMSVGSLTTSCATSAG